MTEDENKSVTLDELRLILHWRHRCHEYEDLTKPCPMRCHQEGIDLCHNLALKFVDLFAEGLKVHEKKLIAESISNTGKGAKV